MSVPRPFTHSHALTAHHPHRHCVGTQCAAMQICSAFSAAQRIQLQSIDSILLIPPSFVAGTYSNYGSRYRSVEQPRSTSRVRCASIICTSPNALCTCSTVRVKALSGTHRECSHVFALTVFTACTERPSRSTFAGRARRGTHRRTRCAAMADQVCLCAASVLRLRCRAS